MSKRSFFMLLVGAAVFFTPSENATQCTQISQQPTARVNAGERVQIRSTSFVINEQAVEAPAAELSTSPLSPYQDHAALPTGAIYTTSDETA